MEYVTPFLVLLAAWGWPITVLVLACIYRKEVGTLIDRIKHLKVLGNDVDASHRQTPSTGEKLGEEAERLQEGRIEPTLKKGMLVRNDPMSLPPPATPPTSPTPAVTAPTSRLQKRIADSIINDLTLKDLDCEEKLKTVVQVQATYQMHLLFERAFRVIFGSQINALTIADNPSGISLNVAESFFTSAKFQFYDIHRDRTFTEWGQFLLSAGLAEEFSLDGVQRARATELGHEFLVYIRARGYPHPIG